MERMTSAEFAEWLAYYSLEPFGADRQDIGHAITACAIVNVHGGNAKVSDFLPEFRPPAPETPEALEAKFRVFAARHNAALEAQKCQQ